VNPADIFHCKVRSTTGFCAISGAERRKRRYHRGSCCCSFIFVGDDDDDDDDDGGTTATSSSPSIMNYRIVYDTLSDPRGEVSL